MSRSLSYRFALLGIIIAFAGCKKDPVSPVVPPSAPVYVVPTTYEFGANTNYKSSADRLSMMKELITYLRSTHNASIHVVIDAGKLQNLFSNTGAPFADPALNTAGLSVREKSSNAFGAVSDIESWLNEAASVSQGTAEATDGTAGKLLGPVPTSSTAVRAAWLVNAKGFEYKELVEKGLMGALQYAEATRLLNTIGSFDNSTASEGSGTAMEHAWDEAFGYFGVPAAFPTVTTGLLYWGNYCNQVNGAINSSSTIMNAFLKGRAAISNKDYAARDEARNVVIATWEQVGAAKLISYFKSAKTNFANTGQRGHALSEAVGFIKAFRYNPVRKISDADIDALLALVGDNLYQVSQVNIDAAITKVSTVFNLDPSKL